MAVSYDAIRKDFEQACDYIAHDLDRAVNQTKGGNYLTASLITCACEALSSFKYGTPRGELFFAELLPEDLKPVGKILYNAIRNGLVHNYDTQAISSDGRQIEIGVSWRDRPHLHLSADGRVIYINITNLSEDFKAAMDRLKLLLQRDERARELFIKAMRSSRVIHLKGQNAVTWNECLTKMKKDESRV